MWLCTAVNMARNDLGRLLMEQYTFDAFSKTQCIHRGAAQPKPGFGPGLQAVQVH